MIENGDYIVDLEFKTIRVYGEMPLADLLRFLAAHSIDPSKVTISSGGDPYLPTEIDWLDRPTTTS